MFAASPLEVGWGWLFITGFMAAAGATVWKLLPWAIKRALEDTIEHQVRPMIVTMQTSLDAVNTRIDSHMENEESSFESIVADVGAMRSEYGERSLDLTKLQATLDDRTTMFDELHATMERTQDVLKTHIAHDEAQFTLSAEALTTGQQALRTELASIKAAVIEGNTSASVERVDRAHDRTKPKRKKKGSS